MIIRKGNNMSENIGRLTVAYIGDTRTIRVVASASGELIREDPVDKEYFTLTDFKIVVSKYKRLCQI